MTGPPPRDRNCFECGRIGHIAVNCPRRVKQKERKKALSEEGKKKLSSLEEKKKCSRPCVVAPISDVSGGVKAGRVKDVNDNFDYNSLKHMEIDGNRGSIDYLKPRDELTLEEPEFDFLQDVLPVSDAQDPGLNNLDNHPDQGEMMGNVEEMKRLNSSMMEQCNAITRRCREERRRK